MKVFSEGKLPILKVLRENSKLVPRTRGTKNERWRKKEISFSFGF